jgi:uncharacterized protein
VVTKLLGGRCKSCGAIFYPTKRLCTKCNAWDSIEKYEFSKKGKIFAFAINNQNYPGIRGPYAAGFVDLPEGIKIWCLIDGWKKPSDLRVGMNVQMVPTRERSIVRFAPSGSGGNA